MSFAGGRPLGHKIVLHHGAHHAGRALGAQRQAALRLRSLPLFHPTAQILAGNGREHLLGYHVSRFTDAADKELRLLHDGRLNGQIPVGAEHLGRRLLELVPEQQPHRAEDRRVPSGALMAMVVSFFVNSATRVLLVTGERALLSNRHKLRVL